MAIFWITVEDLFIAGGVEGRKQGDGPGNLGEREHQFVGAGKHLRLPSGLNHLRVFSFRLEGRAGHLSGRRCKWLRRRRLRRIG
jgi:hypothetical protein